MINFVLHMTVSLREELYYNHNVSRELLPMQVLLLPLHALTSLIANK
jgi:hypothetical protein